MKVLLAFLMGLSWSTCALSQIDFRHGNVQIKQRALRPSDVRAFVDRKDYKSAHDIALQCFKETGDAWCEYYAGQLGYGEPSLAADRQESLRLIRSAASKEVSSAQVFVGNLHFNGQGVAKSASEAIVWWTRAANNCNAWAQNALARVYFDGEHASKDVAEAYFWIKLAAYYRFPNADKGVEVVGASVTEEDEKRTSARVAQFANSRGCGASVEKPVVHEQWSD